MKPIHEIVPHIARITTESVSVAVEKHNANRPTLTEKDRQDTVIYLAEQNAKIAQDPSYDFSYQDLVLHDKRGGFTKGVMIAGEPIVRQRNVVLFNRLSIPLPGKILTPSEVREVRFEMQ